MNSSPFWHPNTMFDAEAVVRRHAAGHQTPRPGLFLSYFGVAIDPVIQPVILAGAEGKVEHETLPANWHSDLAEFAAALRAVDFARDRFTMVELGCGWGCWMNTTGVAARRAGLEVSLYGVEADTTHVRFANEALRDNDFGEDEFTVHSGIAGARAGTAFFPKQEGGHWGLAAIFSTSDRERARLAEDDRYDMYPIVPLRDIVPDRGRIDLLHVDIQGSEADLIAKSLDFLQDQVAYIVIGTHGREIEGRLMTLLGDDGWRLEIERPAIYRAGEEGLLLSVDGVQGWRNMRLLPAG